MATMMDTGPQLPLESIDPATGEEFACYTPWSPDRIDEALVNAQRAGVRWRHSTLEERSALLRRVAGRLREQSAELSDLAGREMGKLAAEARTEIERSVMVLEHYAKTVHSVLAPTSVPVETGTATIHSEALGPLLAVMPWNFPFWQVFRFAAPAIAAGNVVLLKHAPRVTGCGLAIERIWRDDGVPPGIFQTLLIEESDVARLIEDARVRGVTLTGSERAGRAVASAAGRALKKSVLELGGSDPFVVFDDAPLDLAVDAALRSRFANAGQTCIAAKRFILCPKIAEPFLEAFIAGARRLTPGHPRDERSRLAPLARADLRAHLARQVADSVARGARLLLGGKVPEEPGYFYPATILDRVEPGMPAFDEELFGPVAALVRAESEEEAVHLANATRFGLGASVWTEDRARGERLAHVIEAGSVFVNGLVRSDPRLPFGGMKSSGYGHELGTAGLLEWVHQKTLWVR